MLGQFVATIIYVLDLKSLGSLSQPVNTCNPLLKQLHRPPLECGAKLKMRIYSQCKGCLSTCLAVNACWDMPHWRGVFYIEGAVCCDRDRAAMYGVVQCKEQCLWHSDREHRKAIMSKQKGFWQMLVRTLFIFLMLTRNTGSCTFWSMRGAWNLDATCQ